MKNNSRFKILVQNTKWIYISKIVTQILNLIAVVLVSVVVGFFLFKDKLFEEKIPASIDPVYTSFLSCLDVK